MATIQPSRLILGPEDHGRMVSSAEFAEADFTEPWRYERVKGRLVVMSPVGEAHIDASEPWWEALVLYKVNHRDHVQKVVPEAWIRDTDETDRIGDIGVYLHEDRPVRPIPDRVPELMFEVVSPGRMAHDRDYVEKRADYPRLGVREYVVIDRFQKRVTVFNHERGGYVEQILTPTDTYASPLLPGFAVPLAEVLGA